MHACIQACNFASCYDVSYLPMVEPLATTTSNFPSNGGCYVLVVLGGAAAQKTNKSIESINQSNHPASTCVGRLASRLPTLIAVVGSNVAKVLYTTTGVNSQNEMSLFLVLSLVEKGQSSYVDCVRSRVHLHSSLIKNEQVATPEHYQVYSS